MTTLKYFLSIACVCLLGFPIDIYAQIPSLVWANAMGGAGDEQAYCSVLDDSGNVFTTGYFQGTVDFDPGPGTFNLTTAGSYAVFISKLDPIGNFEWAKLMGGASGSSVVKGYSIALDDSGCLYTTGYFYGTADFDPGVATFNLTASGTADIFISKLDPAGNFAWAKKLGANGNDRGFSTALDDSGNVYTTGFFQYTVDFDPGAGVFNLSTSGPQNMFICKLDSGGNFVWAKAMGDAPGVYLNPYCITVNPSGDIYTTGTFNNTVDFDPDTGVANLNSTGGSIDIFISKLDSSGNFIWAKQIGGGFDDVAYTIITDTSGNIFTAGSFHYTADFDPGAGTFNLSTPSGNAEIFVAKLDSSGSLTWAKGMGGVGNDEAFSVNVDFSGNVFTTGYFQATADFDPGAGIYYLTALGSSNEDIFVSKLDPTGNFIWALSIGGSTGDFGRSILLDSSGNIYTTGFFSGTVDFDPGVGVANLSSGGGYDIFLHKMADVPLGTVENYSGESLIIFPNPASGKFMVQSDSDTLRRVFITNILGEVIYQSELPSPNQEIDLSTHPNGIYFVSVIAEGETFTQKIVIQK